MNTVTNNQLSIGDIRIGNRFKIELAGGTYECFVKQIFVNEVEVVISKIMIPTTVSIHKLKPIELTDENPVFKSVFERGMDSSIQKKYYYNDDDEITFSFPLKEGYEKKGFYYYGHWFPCDYLHELQNLFYITLKKNLI